MKRVFKLLAYILLSLITLALIGIAYIFISAESKSKVNLAKLGEEVQTHIYDNHFFRDLNKNSRLDAYEDSRQPMESRVSDLLSQMTLAEKAGTMFIDVINVNHDGELAETPEFGNLYSFGLPGNSAQVVGKNMNHFNLLQTPSTRELARWQNSLQKMAERTRLGIPITIATDPRNHFTNNPLASLFAGDFSLWPEPLGFAAIGDSVLMEKFGNITRQEYRAVGIHLALHPMADLATELR